VSLETKEPVRSARRDATRERVLDAAREVFAERGIFGATVEEICERAGFTRGAFYSNFTDKDDVLEALIDREHGRLIAFLDGHLDEVDLEIVTALPSNDDGSMPIAGPLVERILASVPGDRQLSLVQTELEIHAIRQPGSSCHFIEADARFRARIAAFIERAIPLVGRELIVDAADVADAAVAIVEASVRASLIRGDDDPDAMARRVLPAFIRGVSRPIPPG
jgi:AcrR family transcriptional regulator